MASSNERVCPHRSTLRDYSFLGTAGICIPSNRHSKIGAGTPGYLHIGTGPLVGPLGLPGVSEIHDSQMLPTSSNRRFGSILKVDWKVGTNPLGFPGFGNSLFAEAPDFFESPFRKDSNDESGLGGWGDPNVDFSVADGGFRSLHLSYPSPHTLRRNFTLQPFREIPPPFDVFFPHSQKEANSSFLASEIEMILETSAGDFKGFQTVFEGFEVRT
jgi:hypothetical protein